MQIAEVSMSSPTCSNTNVSGRHFDDLVYFFVNCGMSNKKEIKKPISQPVQKPKQETRLMINIDTSKNTKGRFSEVKRKDN